MPPRWTESSAKHGVSRADATFAIRFATHIEALEVNSDGSVNTLFIGPAHPQTDREIEVIVREYRDGSGREAVVFHVMPLGPLMRRRREESGNAN